MRGQFSVHPGAHHGTAGPLLIKDLVLRSMDGGLANGHRLIYIWGFLD